MQYFENKYPNVYFFLCSDDKQWLEDNLLRRDTDNMVISRETVGVMDFAILASCDHMIISRGTFGWWAGWMVKGTTVYYRDYHPKGTFAAENHPRWSFIPDDEHNHWVSIEK